MMKLQIYSGVGIFILSAVMPVYLPADNVSDNASDSPGISQPVDKADTNLEIDRLEWNIEMAKVKNRVVKKRNDELNSRRKELESRIQELKKTLDQKEAKSTDP